MTRQIVTEIVGDAKKFNKASADASASAGRMGSSFSKMGSIVGTAAKAVAAAVTVAAVAFIALGVKSIGNAVEQERAWNRVKSVFGKGSADVVKWAETNSRAFGVTDDALELSVANYANWAKHAGMSTDAANEGAMAMAKRASEISLATGKSYDTVFAALQKGATGALKGVKEYGVAISTQAIADEAYRLGLIKKGEAVDAGAAAEARASLILKQTAGFSKDAAAMTGGYADSQRKLAVIVDEVQDAIGAAFLNVATAVMPTVIAAFTSLSAMVQTAMPTIQAVVATGSAVVGAALDFISKNVVPVLAAAFAFVTKSVIPALGQAFDWVSKNVVPVINAALSYITANIVPKLVVAFDWVSKNVLPALGQAFTWIAKNIMPTVNQAIDFLAKNVIPPLVKAIGFVTENIIPALGQAFGWINKNVIPPLSAGLGVLGNVFRTVFAAIGVVVAAFQNGISVAFKVVGTAVGVLNTVFGTISTVVGRVFGVIGGIIKGAINGVIGIINGVIGAINAIQVHIHVGPVDLDWNGLNIGRIPRLHSGGVVPGPVGQEVPIMALGGERFIDPHGGDSGGGQTINLHFHGPVYGGQQGLDEIADGLARRMRLQGS